MNSAVKSEDFRFSQLHKNITVEKASALPSRHVRHETLGEKLAGWSNPCTHVLGRTSFNYGISEKSASPVKSRPLPLDLNSHFQSITLKDKELTGDNRGRLHLSPLNKPSKRQPLKGINIGKGIPSIIVHETLFN